MNISLSPGGRRYGALRDLHDSRDYTMNSAPVFRLDLAKLPPRVDLSPLCGPVKDQGQEGSCTGHAYSSIREYLARKFQNASPILSPQFLYAQELLLEGSFPTDGGAQPRTGCVVLDQVGCCEEGIEPYVVGQIQEPTAAQLNNAKRWIGGAYHRLTSPADIFSCLASGYPVSIGFAVYESFESDTVANTGVMPYPNVQKEQFLGRHEVFACGYDVLRMSVTCQNSWGSSWGRSGRFEMPWSVLDNPNMVSDMWLAHLGRAWVPK